MIQLRDCSERRLRGSSDAHCALGFALELGEQRVRRSVGSGRFGVATQRVFRQHRAMIASRIVTPGPLRLAHPALSGPRLVLEPLRAEHVPALLALFDVRIWCWYSDTIDTPSALERMLVGILEAQRNSSTLAFAARVVATGEIVGSSRFLNIDVRNRHVEIGSTWWSPRWQRTFVNTDAKLLMLAHAFETMGALRVELRTDVLNERSRRAIERLGAQYDGVLRAERICDTGRVRDTVVYSMTDLEWPTVRARLTAARP